jgi:hypothetical protein
MAVSFKSVPLKDVGITDVALYTPPASTQSIVFGLIASNKSQTDEWFSISLYNNTTKVVDIVSNVIIPMGSSFALPTKITINQGHTLRVKSKNFANSLDVTASILELT